MRTAQRDQGGTTTFGAVVSDAPSGSGVAQPGSVPFTFIRTGPGVYTYKLDPRINVLDATASAVGASLATVPDWGSGRLQINTYLPTTGAANSTAHHWIATAMDKRT
jgi:hypothetical protein